MVKEKMRHCIMPTHLTIPCFFHNQPVADSLTSLRRRAPTMLWLEQ